MGDQELVGQPAPWDNLDGSPVFKTSILLVRRLPNFMVPFKQQKGKKEESGHFRTWTKAVSAGLVNDQYSSLQKRVLRCTQGKTY